MRFTTSVALSALVSAAAAQNATTYAAGLLGALQAANLTTLLSIATANAAALLPILQQGNHTVFAPTDAAFAALPASVLSNPALVASVVTYHLFNGSFPVSALSQQHTLAISSLATAPLVNLPGGAGQAAVLTSDGTAVTVVQALTNVTSVASTTYQNLVIHIVPTVLTVPANITSTAVAAGLTSLVGALTMYTPTVVPMLDTLKGLTVFAPSNDAFAAAAGLLGTVNASVIATVLANHIINGTVVYSSAITNSTAATSATGQPLTFSTNSTGVYVRSASVVARIIRSDVLVNNGVVHVIDQILVNTATNPAAAASAASSAAVAPIRTATGTTAPGATGSAMAAGANNVVANLVGGIVALVAGLVVVA